VNQVIAIAVGGAVGCVLRFWMSTGVYQLLGRDFPYGTLAVNVLGSLTIGVLYVLLQERLSLDSTWRALLLIGLLGGFTTFSAFAIETVNLIEQNEIIKALGNMLLSVILCVGGAWLGVLAGRSL
jgi:CrcB protein